MLILATKWSWKINQRAVLIYLQKNSENFDLNQIDQSIDQTINQNVPMQRKRHFLMEFSKMKKSSDTDILNFNIL